MATRTVEILVVGIRQGPDAPARERVVDWLYDHYWQKGRAAVVPVRLVPEPTNPVDPNAIRVEVVGREARRVGYLPADEAPRVGQVMARLGPERVRPYIAEMGMGTRGVWMKVGIEFGQKDQEGRA